MSFTGYKTMGLKASVFTTNAHTSSDSDASPRGIVARVRFAMRVRRERNALLSLDDAILKDSGLSRGDVHRESSRRLLDLPSQNPVDRRYRI